MTGGSFRELFDWAVRPHSLVIHNYKQSQDSSNTNLTTQTSQEIQYHSDWTCLSDLVIHFTEENNNFHLKA